jgi:hypothetical protein
VDDSICGTSTVQTYCCDGEGNWSYTGSWSGECGGPIVSGPTTTPLDGPCGPDLPWWIINIGDKDPSSCCCGCEENGCTPWSEDPNAASCPCPSCEAACSCDYLCYSPCYFCSDGQCSAGQCPSGGCFPENGCYTDEFQCNRDCGPTSNDEYCCDLNGAYAYNCAVKKEYKCREFTNPVTGYKSCVCGHFGEQYVPCTECTNTPPPTGEGECFDFTLCEFYYCDLANGGCERDDGTNCNTPGC